MPERLNAATGCPKFRPFCASNDPGTCLWCGRTLAKVSDGHFCTYRCAWQFADAKASKGSRFSPIVMSKKEQT